MILNCISLMGTDGEHLFICLLSAYSLWWSVSVCLRKCQVREIPEVGGHGGEAMNNNKKKLGGICILYAGYFYCTDDRNRQIKLGQPVRHVG